MLAQSLQCSKRIFDLFGTQNQSKGRHQGVGVDAPCIHNPLSQMVALESAGHAVQRGSKRALNACLPALHIGDGVTGHAITQTLVKQNAPALSGRNTLRLSGQGDENDNYRWGEAGSVSTASSTAAPIHAGLYSTYFARL